MGGGTAIGAWVDDWAWLRPLAIPKLSQIHINAAAEPASWDDLTALARQVPGVTLNGSDDHARALLPQLLSPATQRLSIDAHFSDLQGAPNLAELNCDYPTVSELEVILAHPRLREVWFTVEPRVIADLPVGPPSNLLSLDVAFEWPAEIPEINVGEYAWVERCVRLREVIASQPDPAFLAALGQRLGGVETLRLSDADATAIDQLASWTRLRHLELNMYELDVRLDDSLLAGICRVDANLESLELDGSLSEDDDMTYSLSNFAGLKRFSRLKRLRLDSCKLTQEHIAILAELTELEELSLGGNPLDDAAIEPLQRLKRLRMINLDGTDVSDEQFEQIRGDWIERPMVIPHSPVIGYWQSCTLKDRSRRLVALFQSAKRDDRATQGCVCWRKLALG